MSKDVKRRAKVGGVCAAGIVILSGILDWLISPDGSTVLQNAAGLLS